MREGDQVVGIEGFVWIVTKVFPMGYIDLRSRDPQPHPVFADYYPERLSVSINDYEPLK